VEHQRSGGLRAGAQSDRLHDQECRHTASDRHREVRRLRSFSLAKTAGPQLYISLQR
jgi:hypothetical protein